MLSALFSEQDNIQSIDLIGMVASVQDTAKMLVSCVHIYSIVSCLLGSATAGDLTNLVISVSKVVSSSSFSPSKT